MSQEKETATVSNPVERVVSRECYDCGYDVEYSESEFYSYYDAQLGLLHAFNCKNCGLVNSQ